VGQVSQRAGSVKDRESGNSRTGGMRHRERVTGQTVSWLRSIGTGTVKGIECESRIDREHWTHG